MLTFSVNNLHIFPSGFQTLIIIAWGTLLVILPIYATIKIIQSRTMLAFFQWLLPTTKKIGRFMQSQIDDPMKFPRTQRSLEYVILTASYLLAICLFFSVIGLVAFWASKAKNLSIIQQAGILGYSFVCAYFAAALKTQGSRILSRRRES